MHKEATNATPNFAFCCNGEGEPDCISEDSSLRDPRWFLGSSSGGRRPLDYECLFLDAHHPVNLRKGGVEPPTRFRD